MGAQRGGFTLRIEADAGLSFRRLEADVIGGMMLHQVSVAVLCREVRWLRSSQEG